MTTFNEKNIKIQGQYDLKEVKEAIMNYDKKRAEVDTKYVDFNSPDEFEYHIDYLEFLNNVKELLK